MQPVSIFKSDIARDTFSSVTVYQLPVSADGLDVPPCGYAIFLDCREGCLTVGTLDAETASWQQIRSHPVLVDGIEFRVAIELNTVLLGNVTDRMEFEARLEWLTARDMRDVLLQSCFGMLYGVSAMLLVFLAVRLGLGAHAHATFFVLLGMAVLSGVTGLSAQSAARDIEAGLRARLQAQFDLESRLAPVAADVDISVADKFVDRKVEACSEVLALGSFAILMCFVMFIAPSVLFASAPAVLVSALILSLKTRTGRAETAVGRSQVQVARALLALERSRAQMLPRRLPAIRRRILRDSVERYRKFTRLAKREILNEKLLTDASMVVSTVLVVGGYLLSLRIGGESTGVSRLSQNPLIEMAPVLLLFSLASSITRVSDILMRYVARLVRA